MRNLFLVSFVFLQGSLAFSEELSIFDVIYDRVRTSTGTTVSGEKCKISLKNQIGRNLSKDNQPRSYHIWLTQVEVTDAKNNSVNYTLSSRVGGGRGDCPNVEKHDDSIFRVMNNPLACGSSPSKSHFGGIEINQDSKNVTVNILSPEKGQAIGSCTFTK